METEADDLLVPSLVTFHYTTNSLQVHLLITENNDTTTSLAENQ